MSEVTSPDNIVKWTLADPVSLTQESQSQAASIQAAFSKRERYTYMWNNAGEMAAQTGMTEGSLGYQIDTQYEYIYRSSNWRLFNARMQSFTPNIINLSVGAGSANGFVTIAAGWATVFVSLQLGTGFSVGTDVFIEPPTWAPISSTLLGLGSIKLGFSNFEDVSVGATGRYEGTVLCGNNIAGTPYPNGVFRVGATIVVSSAVKFDAITSTVPLAWATGDRMHLNVNYPIEA